ncbi:MAG: hypothetical protein ABR607_02170 [Pyrinomonadaceae bacterium]
MIDPFETSKECIAWAKDHITETERELRNFTKDRDAYAVIVDRDSDATYRLLKLVLRKPMPRALNGHVADTANNLRAALDKSICAVASLCGLPTHTTYFPIAKTETEFDNALNGRCGKLPQDIRNLVRGFEPYKGGNDALWALNKLTGANKHGILKPIALANLNFQLSGEHTGLPAQFPRTPKWDSAKQEMVLARVPKTSTVPDAKFTINFEYEFLIAFNEIELIDGEPVMPALCHFFSVVESIVMAIEAESKRIGLV